MSFLNRETSVFEGQPIELYQLTLSGLWFNYTSASYAINYNGYIFVPVPIKRNNIEYTDDISKNSFTLTMTRKAEFISRFFDGTQERTGTLTIFRGHQNEEEFVVVWKGRIINVTFKGEEADVSCESVFTSLNRQGLRAKYQSLCRHVLYSNKCGVSATDFRVDGTISDINGLFVVVPQIESYPNNYFRAGGINFGGLIYRTVINNQGSTLKVDRPVPTNISSNVIVYAGCNHTSNHCKNKFNNLNNFGGFEFVPRSNPFSTLGDNVMGV